MNELQIFNYNGNKVRTIQIDGEPWWVLKDVCEILGIENHKDLPKRLEDDEVGRFDLPHPQNKTKTLKMVCINESGLYSVILRSDKPEAKPFRKWVTAEVLPSIRKTGGYVVDDEMFVNMYLKDADENIKNLFLITLKALRNKNGESGINKFIACKQNPYMDVNDKVNFINSVVRCGAYDTNTEIKRYQRLYNFFNDAYHIDLKEQTKRYNKTHNKNLAQIRFAAQAGYIDELYKCCFRLYPTASNTILEELKVSY